MTVSSLNQSGQTGYLIESVVLYCELLVSFLCLLATIRYIALALHEAEVTVTTILPSTFHCLPWFQYHDFMYLTAILCCQVFVYAFIGLFLEDL